MTTETEVPLMLMEDTTTVPRTETFYNEFETMDEDSESLSPSELMSIKGKGIIGCIEDLPLWVKLVAMSALTLLGLLGIAIYIVYSQGSTFSGRIVTSNLVVRQLAVANLLRAIGAERKQAAIVCATNDPNQVKFYQSAINQTNTQLTSFKNYYGDVTNVFSSAKNLQQTRTQIQNLQLDRATGGYQAFTFYQNLAQDIISWQSSIILSNSDQLQSNSGPIALLSMRGYEYVSSMSALGAYIFGTGFKLGSANAAKDAYSTASTRYDAVLEVFQYVIDPSVIQKIPEANSSAPNEAKTNCQALINAGFSKTSNSTEIDLTSYMLFEGNMTLWLGGIENATILASNVVKSNIDGNFTVSLLGLIAVIIIMVLLMVCGLLSTICFSRTIVGPWVRMNKVQRTAIKRFVPAAFLKLIDCKTIDAVHVGQSSSKNICMVQVEIKEFSTIAKELDAAKALELLNDFFSAMGPGIREHGGFIERYHFDGFSAVFKTKKQAVLATLEMQGAVEQFNTKHDNYPNITLGMCVHAAKVLVATVGEDERMDCSIASREARFNSQFIELNTKLKTNIIASQTATSDKQQNARRLGVGTDRYGTTLSLFEIFDAKDQLKKKTKKQFNEGVDLFEGHKYYQAQKCFDEVLQEDQADQVAQTYFDMCAKVIEECDLRVRDIEIQEILKTPLLRQAVYDACKLEYSTENYDLLTQCEIFETMHDPVEMRKFAAALYDKYCDINGECAVNITDVTKNAIKKKLDDPNYVVKRGFLDGLHKNMLMNLNDTIGRLITTIDFKQLYMQLMTTGRRSMLFD